jgi:DNA polymerase-4
MLSAPEQVLHLDMDSFFVSVERLKDRRLAGKALLVGGKSDRALVASCSEEAWRCGIRPAMPMKLARRLCPEAISIPGDFESYLKYSRLIREVLAEQVPRYEQAALDEFYIDMSGMDRFLGSWKWAQQLRKSVLKESGLPASMGMSINKLVAKVATAAARPNGQRQVAGQEVGGFLAPLPIRRLPKVSLSRSQELAQMGVRRVEVLREIPREVLEHIFGREGGLLYQWARGIDPSPIVPAESQRQLEVEHSFERDTIDLIELQARLIRMVSQLGQQLRSRQQLCTRLHLSIRYANFETCSRQARFPLTDRDDLLGQQACQAFEKLYQRRLRIRELRLQLSGLAHGSHQLSLLQDPPRQVALHQAIDRLKARFGPEVLVKGNGVF